MDLVNIRKVMTGAISTSDYTVLFLVCNHMAAYRKFESVDLNDLRNELEKLESHRSNFLMYRQRLPWNHNLKDGRIQKPIRRQESSRLRITVPYSNPPVPVLNGTNSRPRRQRRAPNRLNIATTRGRSYQN